MSTKKRLKKLFDEILSEVETNPPFAERIKEALGELPRHPKEHKKSGRRTSAVLDPITIIETEGEESLRDKLQGLDVGQLKDVVAEYAMDPAKLVMKWAAATRIIEHIVSTSSSRAKKGDAFR